MSVYFIQQGVHGPIKIGSSRNVDQRLRTLQSANPELLWIRLILDGGLAEERALQRRFAADRTDTSSEWFKPSEAVMDFIQAQPLAARLEGIYRFAARIRSPSKKALKELRRKELRDMQLRARHAARTGRIIYCPESWRSPTSPGTSCS